ncbi:MAG: flagellar M-ring protein FliF, partial [Bdellovibrionales bacterium]|nr:flagellar M-ring protein FliF [Bdellovibrionales bacterium]
LSGELMELKQKSERQIEQQIEDMLSKVVGVGKVIARVSAKINVKEMASVEETVDPDRTAIRSVQSEEEKLNGSRSNPTGIPGARANLPGAEDTGQVGFQQDVNKELKVTNYDVPKTIRNIKEAPGAIEQLSIAVLVDGKSISETNDAGDITNKWEPRTEQDLKKYESLIKSAIGFNAKRGDTISVENMMFEKEDFSESVALLNQLERRKLIRYIFKWSALGFAFALLFFLIIRPFMRWITDSFQESIDDMLPKTIEELEELQSIDNTLPGMSGALPMLEEAIDPDKAESELLKERIMGFLDRDEKKASDALSLWLVRRDL